MSSPIHESLPSIFASQGLYVSNNMNGLFPSENLMSNQMTYSGGSSDQNRNLEVCHPTTIEPDATQPSNNALISPKGSNRPNIVTLKKAVKKIFGSMKKSEDDDKQCAHAQDSPYVHLNDSSDSGKHSSNVVSPVYRDLLNDPIASSPQEDREAYVSSIRDERSTSLRATFGTLDHCDSTERQNGKDGSFSETESPKNKRKQKFSFSNLASIAIRNNKDDLHTEDRDQQELDLDAPENIGLKLALPSAIDIMTGKEPLPPPGSAQKNLSLADSRDDTSQLSETGFSAGTYAKLDEEYLIRTSELEPSQHQITVPTAEEFLVHTRICSLMEDHSFLVTNQNANETFDFNMLCGLSREKLDNVYRRIIFSETQKEPYLTILKSLSECTDDLIVEGYFTDSSKTANSFSQGGAEISVFSTQRYRQFIVCYRGSHEQQAKPMSCKAELQKKQGM